MRTPQAMTPRELQSLRQMVVTLSADHVAQTQTIVGAKVEVMVDREGLLTKISLCEDGHGWKSWTTNPHTLENTALRHAILAAVDAGTCLIRGEDIAGHHESLTPHNGSGPLSLFSFETNGEISSHMRLKAMHLKEQLREWAKNNPINTAGVEYNLDGLS